MPRRIGRALRIRSAIYGEGNWQPSKRDASTGTAARLMLSIADKCQHCALFGHHSKSKLEKVQLLLCFSGFNHNMDHWMAYCEDSNLFDSRAGSTSKQVKEAGLLMLKL